MTNTRHYWKSFALSEFDGIRIEIQQGIRDAEGHELVVFNAESNTIIHKVIKPSIDELFEFYDSFMAGYKEGEK